MSDNQFLHFTTASGVETAFRFDKITTLERVKLQFPREYEGTGECIEFHVQHAPYRFYYACKESSKTGEAYNKLNAILSPGLKK